MPLSITFRSTATIALLGFCAVRADAQTTPQGPTQACVEVEVDGQKVQSFGCLTEKLAPVASPARPQGAPTGAEDIVRRPANALGLYNRAATATRMGSNFGVSVVPQRPAP